MSFNQIILFGRLTADPELKDLQGGLKLCTINLAVDRQKTKDGTQATDYFKCNVWGKTAEMVDKYFAKGKPILVVGSMQDNDYTDKNGIKHYSKVVQVQSVNFTINDNPKSANQGQKQRGYTKSRPAPPVYDSAPALEDYEEILSDGEIPF